MRRVCLLALLICTSLAWSSTATAQLSSPSASVPVALSSGPGADVTPQLAVSSSGRAVLAWKYTAPENDSAAILLAQAPGWQVQSLTSVPVESIASIEIQLPTPYAAGQLLWRAAGQALQRLSWDGNAWPPAEEAVAADPSTLDFPSEALLLLDGLGRIHAAWLQDNAIHYRAEPAISATLPITLPLIDDSLAMTLDAGQQPHWAVLARAESGAETLLYVSLATTTLVAEGNALGDARLWLGPTGEVHIIWRADGGLYHAASSDWGRIQALLAVAPRADQWAAAAGPDETLHLAWMTEGALRYTVCTASAGVVEQRQLVSVPMAAGVQVVVDAWSRPHLAWSAPDEAGDWQVYYLPPPERATQLMVTAPTRKVLLHDARVQVVSNVPPDGVLDVTCYLEEAWDPQAVDDVADSALMLLGAVTNGPDGWSVELPLAMLQAGPAYRAVAYGVDAHGLTVRAVGEWFYAQPPGTMWAESRDVVRGRSVLHLYGDGVVTPTLPVMVALQPIREGLVAEATADLAPSLLLAAGELSSTQVLTVPLDSRQLADGDYVVLVGERAARAQSGPLDATLTIANAMPPTVRVTAPSTHVVTSDRIYAAAEVDDPDGRVRRVDFFLERGRTLLESLTGGADQVTTCERVWLGSDRDGSNGWGVRLPVITAYDGDGWYVRAIAYDDDDLASSALSAGSFTVLAEPRPLLRLLTPSPDEVVRGVQQVSVLAMQQQVDQVALYLEAADGNTYPVGLLRLDGSRWETAWDSSQIPDALYSLLVIGSHDGMPVALVRCPGVQVRNHDGDWAFAPDIDGQVLRGHRVVQVTPLEGAATVHAMHLYCRDATGEMLSIGEGAPTDGGWRVVWDTHGVVDGAYTLVALLDLADESSAQRVVQAPVTVRNNALEAQLAPLGQDGPLQGLQTISWTMRGAGPAAQVDLAYSPDAGRHWLELARGLTGQFSYEWDTRSVPDSTQAQLRLTVGDGAWQAVTTSGPWVVNNVNAVPSVALLQPAPDSAHADILRVVWQTYDPDGDPLRISLAYRRSGGEWIELVTDLRDTGSYTWYLEELAAASDYELRITARDPDGATDTQTVAFALSPSPKPPRVELLWPNGGAELSDDTVILWNADDEQGEALSIDLFYSDNAGQTWLPLAEGLGDVGYYHWQVSSLPSGDHYRVRVVVRTARYSSSSESDGVFSIGTAAWSDASLLAPVAHSTVSGLQVVRWSLSSAASAGRSTSLQIRRAEAGAWQTLGLDLAEAGVFLWNTRLLADGEYDLRLGISSDGTLAATRYTQPRRVVVRNQANRPPEVRLTAPIGGEHWSGVHEITWQAHDPDGQRLTATLWLSWNNGQHWERLAELDAAEGRYLWDTRQATRGSLYAVRITVSDGRAVPVTATSGPVVLDNLGGQPPTAAFSSPDDEGLLADGRVAWTTQDADGLTVSLALRAEDAGAEWRVLSEDLPPSGSYVLSSTAGIDPNAIYGEPFRLRLSVSDRHSRVYVDSAPVVLEAPEPPTLRLISTAVGQTISGTQALAWELSPLANGRGAMIDIDYSRDGERTWLPLAHGLSDSSNYSWDTRDLPNGIYVLRLSARLGAEASLPGASLSARAGPFEVRNAGCHEPVISLLEPVGGATVCGTQTVRWLADDPDGDALSVVLAYSIDDGMTWRPIASQLANSGSYVWDTTIAPNCARVWLRATASDGRYSTDVFVEQPLTVQNAFAPVVVLLYPADAGGLALSQSVSWTTLEEPTSWVRASVDYTLDGGLSWESLGTGLPATGSLVWDTRKLLPGSEARVRVTVSDGLHAGVAIAQVPLRVP